jgi:hypothetical protein
MAHANRHKGRLNSQSVFAFPELQNDKIAIIEPLWRKI